MSRPDVALVTPYPARHQRAEARSGVTSYSANLAHALAGAGARVEVVSDVADDDRTDPWRDGDVAVRPAYRRGPRALVDAVGAACATGAPVVHLQLELFLYGGPPTLATLPVALGRARARGHRPVVTLHQVVDPSTVDRTTVALHRVGAPPVVAAGALAAVQRTVGHLAAPAIVHEAPFARHVPGSVVIPHGVEAVADEPPDEARNDLGLDGRLTVLCFGYVAPYKGLDAVLAAAERCAGEVDVVVAGGDHPRLAERERYGDQLRARYGDVATFTGWVPPEDVARWFSAVDVALFPYPRPFASSGALAAALAHGTPVLLSAPLARCLGAPSDLAVDPEPAALAERLTGLARDLDQLKRLTAWTEALTAGRSWPEVARRHLDVYEPGSDW